MSPKSGPKKNSQIHIKYKITRYNENGRQSQKHKATGTTTVKKAVGINHTLVEGVGNLVIFIISIQRICVEVGNFLKDRIGRWKY